MRKFVAALALLSAPVAAVPIIYSPSVLTWQPAPLEDGGYARVTKACEPWGQYAAPPVGTVYVMVNHGGGWTADNRKIHSLWPQNSIGVPFTAIYVYTDCLEGVRLA